VDIEDIFSGQNTQRPATDFVPGTAKLDNVSIGNPILCDPALDASCTFTPTKYTFHLGSLSAGGHVLTYDWKLGSNICGSGHFGNAKNEVHVVLDGGPQVSSVFDAPISITCP
jgi:hypothetical protein